MTALSLRAQLETAFALHQQGCFSEAASQYQAVLSIQPDNFNALHMLGVLALQNNNAEQARALIEQAAAIR
ncbi:MAG: tetratricopeptide repeat protein, partial [Methylophilaceae bacterium]|nr:tetratricopeptide repeat protein [Methylophilaceae bacterium]